MDIFDNGIWAWRQGIIALTFLAMGGLYWKYEKQMDGLMKYWLVALLFISYLMIVLFADNTNPLISTLGIQPLGFITSAIACLLLVWLCKKMPEIRPLTFIGRNSIGFYFMSGALPISISMLIHKFYADSYVWMMLIIWISCLVFAYIAVAIINRWSPWLWDLRQLKRLFLKSK